MSRPADTPAGQLELLRERISRVEHEPDKVSAPLVRLVRPILRRMGYVPVVSSKALSALLWELRSSDQQAVRPESGILHAKLDAALKEFELSVQSVERTCVVNRKIPAAHIAWLLRMHAVLERLIDLMPRISDRAVLRMAGSIDTTLILPPLAVRPSESEATAVPESPVVPGWQTVLLQFQLGAVDTLLRAARSEKGFLDRRRRMFEASRQLLLETAAALPLDVHGVEQRHHLIAREISRADRLEAAGVNPSVDLLHQARSAVGEGDVHRLVAVLTALESSARATSNEAMTRTVGEALDRLWGARNRFASEFVNASQSRSAAQILGTEVISQIFDGYDRARQQVPKNATALHAFDQGYFEALKDYLSNGNESATLRAAVMVDGCFEAGGVFSPVRVEELEKRTVAVRFPTPKMTVMQAQDITDLPDAIIDDPRAIIANLASGKLLARRFMHDETIRKTRTVMQGEVRVFLLDGSSSMLGPRARMRDSIMIAEIATLMKRLQQHDRTTRVSLFYRFFNDQVGPIQRIDTLEAGQGAVSSLLANMWRGGTEIEDALVASLGMIADARKKDPDLSRAQIVLVTDGEAVVRESIIKNARMKVGNLPIGVSVIALGQENYALREIVSQQRQGGERAFYHYVDDSTLGLIERGELDRGAAMHLPNDHPLCDPNIDPTLRTRLLGETVGELVDEMASLGQVRDVDAIEQVAVEREALNEMGVDASALTHGERARMDAASRDHRALSSRFNRWFPAPALLRDQAPTENLPAKETPARAVYDTLWVMLATLAEVIAVIGGSLLQRQSDAIDILERLLSEAEMVPGDYEKLLEVHREHLSEHLHALHDAINQGSVKSTETVSASRKGGRHSRP